VEGSQADLARSVGALFELLIDAVSVGFQQLLILQAEQGIAGWGLQQQQHNALSRQLPPNSCWC